MLTSLPLLRKEVLTGATNGRSFTSHWVFPGPRWRATCRVPLCEGCANGFISEEIDRWMDVHAQPECCAVQVLNANGKPKIKNGVVSGVSRCPMRQPAPLADRSLVPKLSADQSRLTPCLHPLGRGDSPYLSPGKLRDHVLGSELPTFQVDT